MVSGLMPITQTTLNAGSGAIGAQRGTQTWGANYVFNPSGLQNDIYMIAESFRASVETSGVNITPQISGNVTFMASGTTTFGSASAPIAVSGIFMNGPAGAPYRLVITAGGLVSGVAV